MKIVFNANLENNEKLVSNNYFNGLQFANDIKTEMALDSMKGLNQYH